MSTNVYDLFTGRSISQESVEVRSPKKIKEQVLSLDEWAENMLAIGELQAKQSAKHSKFVETKKDTFRKRTVKDKVCHFTYRSRNNRYVKSNCYLDMNTLEAHSYKWWIFVKKIQGKLVFNEYNYSRTTSKHQKDIKYLLEYLNIRIELTVKIKDGLQNFTKLKELKAFVVKKSA